MSRPICLGPVIPASGRFHAYALQDKPDIQQKPVSCLNSVRNAYQFPMSNNTQTTLKKLLENRLAKLDGVDLPQQVARNWKQLRRHSPAPDTHRA